MLAEAFLHEVGCIVQAFKGIKALVLNTLFNAVDAKGVNPLWPGILYEGTLQTS